MKLYFHKNFQKAFEKLQTSEQEKCRKRLKLFLKDEFGPLLNNHPLRGRYNGYRSINITGDIRAIYKRKTSQRVIFVILGNHNNLYN
jgi:addiction module RelE/StbE family toxin